MKTQYFKEYKREQTQQNKTKKQLKKKIKTSKPQKTQGTKVTTLTNSKLFVRLTKEKQRTQTKREPVILNPKDRLNIYRGHRGVILNNKQRGIWTIQSQLMEADCVE